jgi:hypothetical protein
MKHMMLRVAGLMVLFGALSVATAHADTRFSIHVGVVAPPAVVAPGPSGYGGYDDGYYAPYPGYVWQPGYYVGYRWTPGAWVPRGRYVAAPHYGKHDWKRDRGDWERARGNWERNRRYNERDRRRW